MQKYDFPIKHGLHPYKNIYVKNFYTKIQRFIIN